MNGVTFGSKHSWRDWHCVLNSWDIPLPDVNEDLITVPGMDGSLDQTEYLAGITYKDRTLKFNLTYIGAPSTFHQKRQEIASLLHGKVARIIMDSDPDYYYEGRCQVENFKAQKAIATFTVSCRCCWKIRRTVTSYTKTLTGSYQSIILYNERRPVVPSISVQYASTIKKGSQTISLAAGTHRPLDLQLVEGLNIIEAKLTNASSGSITIEYQEASF